jgi:hypothetical protein
MISAFNIRASAIPTAVFPDAVAPVKNQQFAADKSTSRYSPHLAASPAPRAPPAIATRRAAA